MALTAEQRHAQRVIVGVVRAGGARLSRERLSIWRARGSEEWQRSSAEITPLLDVLEVPYSVSITRGPSKRTARQLGFRIDIEWDDLPLLERWVPSLRALIDAVESSE